MNTYLESIRNGVSLREFVAKLPRVPLASAISGLVVAALILMTPNPWFEAFIAESGLSTLFSGAEPPLGARARIVFALIAALLVTTAAWIVLSIILGRKSTGAEPWAYERDGNFGKEDKPVLRRADRHPDAPSRRPIMAGEDLGTPLDLVDVVTDPVATADPIDFVAAAVDRDDGAEPVPDTSADDDAGELEEVATEPAFTIPLRSRASVADEPSVVEPTVSEPVADNENVQPAGGSKDARGELVDLMVRLEAGIERRRAQSQSASGAAVDDPAKVGAEDRDTALRDALDALQRLSARGA